MIPSNVIQRTFHLRFDTQVGTAFVLDVESKQYFITAKHIIPNISASTVVYIRSKEEWLPITCRFVGYGSENSDIIVLAPHRSLADQRLTLKASSASIIYGQDTYFLGFPSVVTSKLLLGQNEYPLPFVRKAIVSCFDQPRMWLDGHNIPGFSGGPVVYKNVEDQQFYISAVISGYLANEARTIVDGNPTNHIVSQNTGLICAYSIYTALEVIKRNPIGFPISM